MTSIFKDQRALRSTDDVREVGVKHETIRIAGSQHSTIERYRTRHTPHDINSCHGTRKDGGSCGAYPMKDRETCFFHSGRGL